MPPYVQLTGRELTNEGLNPRKEHDVCMVFPRKVSAYVAFDDDPAFVKERGLKTPSDKDKAKMDSWKQTRASIIENLRSCGLNLYAYHSRDRDAIVLKVGADGAKLKDTAAQWRYKLQLKPEYSAAWAEYRHDFPGRPENHFADRITVSHLYQNHGQDEYDVQDAIFKTIDRISLVDHIIRSDDKDCAGVDVGTLVHNGMMKSYFPLHENGILQKFHPNLHNFIRWLEMDQTFSRELRDYFGDRTAMYFMWVGFYWKWLVPVAAVGLALAIYDIVCMSTDNAFDVPFCIFISLWAMFLPHFWRREEAKHAIEWGTIDMEPEFEPARPEHWGELRMNPITSQVEAFYPFSSRIWHYLFSSAVITTSIVLLLSFVLTFFIVRHALQASVPMGRTFFRFSLALIVEIMNTCLGEVARWLTDRENHRAQSEYEFHLLGKMILFKFVGSYWSLYYIAFFKRHSELIGLPMDCEYGDCFLDLDYQMRMFVIVRLTLSNFGEFFWPRIKAWWQGKAGTLGRKNLEHVGLSNAERQAKMNPFKSFEEFDEVLITHGYACFFAVSCPWVPLLILVSIIVEFFLDASNAISASRRPTPARARNNEPWDTAFEVFGIIACITNMALVIFGSREYEGWRLTEKLSLFFILEHFLVWIYVLFITYFPALPTSVKTMSLKQRAVLHRVMGNTKPKGEDISVYHGKGHKVEVLQHDPNDDEESEPMMTMRDTQQSLSRGMKEGMRSVRAHVTGR